MPDIQNAKTAPSAYSAADIDSILDDLDLEAMNESLEVIEELDENEIDAIEIKLELNASYAQQNSAVMDPSAEPPVSKKKSRVLNLKNSMKKASASTERDLSKIPPEQFQLEGDFTGLVVDPSVKTDTLLLRPQQKKIGEKFDNMFISLNAGRLPSTFIVDALELLMTTGRIDNGSLVSLFSNAGYHIGTARSQAGQLLKLFEVLKIGKVAGKNTLAFNPISTIAQRISQLTNKTAA